MHQYQITGLTSLAATLVLSACSTPDDRLPHQLPRPEGLTRVLPAKVEAPLKALPAPPVTDPAKVALGETLYFDKRLSGDGTVSCASCHALDKGGADALAVSVGIRGQHGPINAPTVFNSHLNFVQFWDGRAKDLAEQAAGPVENPKEMGAKWDDVVARLSTDPAYVEAFAKAGYSDGFTRKNATEAIAEYERTLVTPARFDRFAKGEVEALSLDEREGLELFTSLGCTTCHQGPGLGGTMYQKMGAAKDYFAARGGPITDADLGRFNVTRNEADRHHVKVPILRNVELTAPYFHDGHAKTLDEAVVLMARHQLNRELKPREVKALVAFLESLTGEKLPSPPAEVN